MSLDGILNLPVDPWLRDELEKLRDRGVNKYSSPWVSIDAGAVGTFTHGLGEIPTVVSVLEATDSQGTGQAEASSVTISRTVTLVSVANTGTARFFRVRAF